MHDIIASFHMENQIRSQWGKQLIRQLSVWSDESRVSRFKPWVSKNKNLFIPRLN